MNVFDYFFEKTKSLDKGLVLGSSEKASYREVFSDCINLAGFIQKEVGSQKKILILSQNSLFFIKAYLAILKSGNICVPVNTEIEKENLNYIISKCNSDIIFISKRYNSLINNNPGIAIDESKMASLIEQNVEKDVIDSEYDDQQIAEIIFTSGSMGSPKGVVLSHKNLMANTSSIIKYLRLDESDIIQVVLPFYYCYGLSLLHTHLRVGGSLVLTNSFIFLGTVINDLKNYNCTGFAGVPSHFQILLRKANNFKTTKFPHLRYVTQAGGKLHNIFIEEFLDSFPDTLFYVMYGQTEATARLSYLPPELVREKLGSIGKGIPGVELNVIDVDGNKVKEGEIGEIVARGDSIMLGYLDDEKSTHEVMHDLWLKTGDLGQVDKDGYIYISGRKKEIIKVGGNRINPKEIEEIILQIPSVIDCSIQGIDHEVLGESIKAELTVLNTDEISVELVKEYCSRKLAHYKIPQIVEIRTDLKISSTGKKVKGK